MSDSLTDGDRRKPEVGDSPRGGGAAQHLGEPGALRLVEHPATRRSERIPAECHGVVPLCAGGGQKRTVVLPTAFRGQLGTVGGERDARDGTVLLSGTEAVGVGVRSRAAAEGDEGDEGEPDRSRDPRDPVPPGLKNRPPERVNTRRPEAHETL
ncbi:hypothetical protein [Georgenia sp. SUBG003]|uniref:hypothetical protein n=1 Tax=Georgenia sp. SUBG003 TaxID=1497974 RepID=UPI0005B8A4AD